MAVKREVIRIEVTPQAKEIIEQWAREIPMPQTAVASKIYEWFGQQSEEVQRGILGLYGRWGPEIARKALENMATEPSGKEGGGKRGKRSAA